MIPENTGPTKDEMATRKVLMLRAYAKLAEVRENLAHANRVFEGYRLLAISGLVLLGESVTGAERVVEQWLK